MEAWPMVAEERSVFAMFAPSELHACPDRFEQLLFGVFGLIRLEGHERKTAVAAIAGGDVQTARAGVSGFEVMDIIARGGKGADAARRHGLAAVCCWKPPEHLPRHFVYTHRLWTPSSRAISSYEYLGPLRSGHLLDCRCSRPGPANAIRAWKPRQGSVGR